MANRVEIGRVVPDANRVFDYPDYRLWVNEVNLVVSVPNIKEVQLLPKEGIDLTPKDKALLRRLNAEPGFIQSGSVIFNPPENEVPSADYQPVIVTQYVHRLRDRVENPEIILVARGLGVGIGIDHYSFKHSESARLFFYLKTNFKMNELVPRRVAAEKLFGTIGDPENRLDVAIYCFKKSVTEDAKVGIESTRGFISLVER